MAPNKVDFDFIFKNLSFAQNPSIYVTLLVVFGLYFTLMLFARHLDIEVGYPGKVVMVIYRIFCYITPGGYIV